MFTHPRPIGAFSADTIFEGLEPLYQVQGTRPLTPEVQAVD